MVCHSSFGRLVFSWNSSAARVGFDWLQAAGALEVLREELDQLAMQVAAGRTDRGTLEDEICEFLFSAVVLARKLGIDPEAALRGNNEKFEDRFDFIKRGLKDTKKSLDTASLTEKRVK